MLQQERGHRKRLEEMVEQLAKQQRQLEQQAHRIIPSEFFFKNSVISFRFLLDDKYLLTTKMEVYSIISKL